MELEKLTEPELWEVLRGLCEIMQSFPEFEGGTFFFWYAIFTEVRAEVDRRLNRDF